MFLIIGTDYHFGDNVLDILHPDMMPFRVVGWDGAAVNVNQCSNSQ